MSEIRYMANRGFEEAEEEMLEEMSRYASEGWLLHAMTSLRLEFQKAESRKIQYGMEYQPALGSRKEYLDAIKRKGWTFVCESEGFRIFSAPAGTRIWDVNRSHLQKRIQKKRKKLLFMIFISILIFVMDFIWGSSFGTGIQLVVAIISAALFGYGWSGFMKLGKKREKKGK